jgi:hypothetical protein
LFVADAFFLESEGFTPLLPDTQLATAETEGLGGALGPRLSVIPVC